MGYKTYNVKVPDGFYHLQANQVRYLVENSLQSEVSSEDLARYLERDSGVSRRVAKALANRVSSSELTHLHSELCEIPNDDGRLLVDYDGSRNYVTLIDDNKK